ncbi:MAG: HNH endonuclease [Acidobacteria bacterium 13_1_20CM_3_53_8]|nr:MAG: HNH endonuclease [Acidobacteria bacterium 13_1_20CM_3_53_8]
MNPHYPLVSARARHACEYCRAPEIVFNLPFEVEHITPQSRGGETTENNLALSCRSCNLYKSDYVSAVDELTQQETELFNPRRNKWHEHFSIIEETGEIKGLSASGRVTISCLRINSKAQVEARKQWLLLGLMNRS